MSNISKGLLVLLFAQLFPLSVNLYAQDAYELRKFSEQQWLNLTTDEKLRALNTSNNHAVNKTFVGDFNADQDLYNKWGYDYYEMSDIYENYSFRGFDNYNILEDRRNKWYYNQFGDRMTKMTRGGGIWLDRINDDGTSSVSTPWGYLNTVNAYQSSYGTDGLWVARESTDDWAISAIGAGALRAKLTPLTISYPNLNGMKVDFQSQNYSATLLNATMDENGAINYITLLRGAQIKRKFGALTIGSTFATLYNQYLTRDGGTNFKGSLHDYAPTPLYLAVRVMDDSPQDGNGPSVHDINLIVNGVSRPDLKPMVLMDDLSREKVTAIKSKGQMYYLDPNSTYINEKVDFTQTSVNERVPKYADYLYMKDYLRGWNTSTLTNNFDVEKGKEYYKVVEQDGKPAHINGTQYLVYLFDIGTVRDIIKRIQVEIKVSNDYKIQSSQISTKTVAGGHDTKGEEFTHYAAEFWRTVAEADGNIKDNSNLRTIRFDFGYEVGTSTYGFNAQFNYLGFNLNGEFVKNTHYYMFADNYAGTGLPANTPTDITKRNGHRSSQTDNAYYLIGNKEWKKFGISGEIFKMGKFYRPYSNFYVPSNQAGGGQDVRNDIIKIPMIADNDDNDQYPDIEYQGQRIYSLGILTQADPDGVFPGNDLNYDSIPDNEKNNNGIPDYEEPFFMYDVDPDEFVFGDDFNNNGIADFREDDIKFDTPYDLDRHGRHFYIRYTPQKNLNFIIGSSLTRGVGADSRTDNNYFKTNFSYSFLSVGNIFAEYRHENIQDDIQDSYVVPSTIYLFKRGPWGLYSRYNSSFRYDEIEYKNSSVDRLFLETKIRTLPSLIIENHVKFESNEQLQGTMYNGTFQPKDDISTLAMINKFTYTKDFGNFTFSPGLKYRFYKKGRSESMNPLDHYSLRIPMIYFKYKVSNNTKITLGLEGFTGFEMLYKDYIQSQNDFKQTDYMLMFENANRYFGFDVWGGFGYKLQDIKYLNSYRKFEDSKSTEFFVQIWCGNKVQ